MQIVICRSNARFASVGMSGSDIAVENAVRTCDQFPVNFPICDVGLIFLPPHFFIQP